MVKVGYKQTEIGVIPEDWEIKNIGQISEKIIGGGTPSRSNKSYWGHEIPWVTVKDFSSFNKFYTQEYITKEGLLNSSSHLVKKHTIIISTRMALGKVVIYDIDVSINQDLKAIYLSKAVNNNFFFYWYQFNSTTVEELGSGSTVKGLSLQDLKNIQIPIPPIEEQKAIAEALGDTDALITSLEKLIAKKERIKQGTMQQLLTGKKRLEGFSGAWDSFTIEDIAVNLDNLRIPLNENQRSKMRGNIPYCGANGIVDFVNDYVVDDDILLMAEDGGYFDEYATRPIVYRMIGKCWVNNHAHILKAKANFSQDYLFYSLVHKDITKFLASGTRAKLNKSEMFKIEIFAPKDFQEQQAIAQILSDMDSELEAFKAKLSKTKAIKEGMMSELLTGKTRLKGAKDE